MKILVVEDNPSDRALLYHNFQKHGAHVLQAGNGQEALNILAEHTPEIIISDILMPEMDGFNFLRTVKNIPTKQHIPFVFYSSVYTKSQDGELAFALGADAFLVKPMKFEKLLTALDEIVTRKQSSKNAKNIIKNEEEFLARYCEIVSSRLEEKIAELEKNKRELECKQSAFQNLFENIRDVIIVTDQNHLIGDINQNALQKMFGYCQDEVIGQEIRILYDTDEEYQKTGNILFNKIISHKKKVVESIMRKKDGSVFHGEINASKFLDEQGNDIGNISIIRDISQRKIFEEELLRREERFRHIITHNADAIIVLDEQGLILFANPACEHLFGKTENQLIGSHFGLHCSNELANEISIFCSDGSSKIGEVRFEKTEWEGKHCQIATIRDVTKFKEATADQRRLQAAIEQLSEIVLICAVDEKIEYINPAIESLCAVNRQKLIGKKISDWMYDVDLFPRVQKSISVCGVWTGDITLCDNDNQLIITEASITPIRDTNGDVIHYVAIMKDTTHVKQLERQLRQAQKMEAVGTLAGGIAHDFNNILAPILGYTELIMQEHREDSRLNDDLQQIYTASLRAKDLVQQILAVSRQTEKENKPLDIRIVVKEAMKLLRASIPSTITMSQKIPSQPLTVLADLSQIHQIVMNLCTNAFHAMQENGGTLTVDIEKIQVEEEMIQQDLSLEPGSYARLSVSDTGCGIEKSLLDRIFEPYFTTKKKGEGTGLGLAVVHGIVKSYQGAITVYSSKNEGTTFHVYLPLIISAEQTTAADDTEIPGGTEHILIVDDEVAITMVLKRVLSGLGYTVTARSSSLEGLEAFRNDPNRFDLLLTDLTMPQMSGDRLAREILSIRPSLPVILCSGFSENISKEKTEKIGIKAFLNKPVIKKNLAEKIRNALDN